MNTTLVPIINTWNPNNGYDNTWWLNKHKENLDSIKDKISIFYFVEILL
jgi:hypothetical protein